MLTVTEPFPLKSYKYLDNETLTERINAVRAELGPVERGPG